MAESEKQERGTGTDTKGDPARVQPYGDEPLAETTQVQPESYHLPGAPLETQADREAREAKEAEPVVDPEVPEPAEYAGVDTRSPDANLATRSNIASDGPGTVGYVGSLGSLDEESREIAEDVIAAQREDVEGDGGEQRANVNPGARVEAHED